MDERRDPGEPAAHQPVPPSSPLGRGWNTAVVRAVLAVAALLLLAQAVVVLAYFAAEDPTKPSAGTVARFGGVVFYAFHHVGFRLDFPRSALAQPGTPLGAFAGAVVAFAAMAGTFLGLWLLYLGGRAVARECGGSTLARGLHGLKVAPPYAALALAGSFLLRFKPEDGAQTPTIHPSYAAALLWPIALAAAAGFVGGVRSEHQDGGSRLIPDRETLGRRLYAALAGGWRMILFGLVFAFVGLLVMAVVKPDATGDYFSSFDRGTLDGVLAIVGTLLLLPNMAAWVLFPAMGSCVSLSGPLSICFLSYRHFPRGTATAFAGSAGAGNPFGLNLPSAPGGYFLFLLVPLAAVLLGGMAAARKGRATTRNQAVALGGSAGVVFAALSVITVVLASISIRISGGVAGITGSGSFRIGPELTSSVLWALLWGVVGGALGGLWEGRSLPSTAVAVQTMPPGPPAPPSDQREERG